MDFITVNCTVSFNQPSDDSNIKFTIEDIPFVIYFRELYEYSVVDEELKVLNFHVNDDRTICSVYDLKFQFISRYGHEGEGIIDRAERIKRELANPDLKLTAPRDIFMKFIKDTDASVNRAELQRLYPDAFAQWMNDERPESNPVGIILRKKDRMFPSSGGRRKNGRRCRRTRQKTKRVKRAKLMKSSRNANHIKNVKH
jgi:hypothetical protein